MATNMFMFLGKKIEGEAEDDKYNKWCEIIDLSHEFEQKASPLKTADADKKQPKTEHKKLHVSKYIDNATPEILKVLWKGTILPKVIIKCLRAAGKNPAVDFLTIEMDDVIISKYVLDTDEGKLPTEKLELDYAVVGYWYKSVDKKTKGTVPGVKCAGTDRDKNDVF